MTKIPAFPELAAHCVDEKLSPDNTIGAQAMRSYKIGYVAGYVAALEDNQKKPWWFASHVTTCAGCSECDPHRTDLRTCGNAKQGAPDA